MCESQLGISNAPYLVRILNAFAVLKWKIIADQNRHGIVHNVQLEQTNDIFVSQFWLEKKLPVA